MKTKEQAFLPIIGANRKVNLKSGRIFRLFLEDPAPPRIPVVLGLSNTGLNLAAHDLSMPLCGTETLRCLARGTGRSMGGLSRPLNTPVQL
jgi:hypothetical protein